MRIEVRPQINHPVPQFVVYAENDAERAILQCFTSYREYAREPVLFHMHGSSWTNGGCSSFNFGYVFKKDWEPKKPKTKRKKR